MNKKDKYGNASYGKRDLRKRELRRYLRNEAQRVRRLRKVPIEDLVK